MKDAIIDDFEIWLKRNGRVEKSYQDQLDVFMEDRYAMKPADGSIFDQIKAMNSPPPSSDKNEDCKTCSSARLQYLAACAKKTQQDLERRKRSTSGKIVPNSFMHCKKLLPNATKSLGQPRTKDCPQIPPNDHRTPVLGVMHEYMSFSSLLGLFWGH